MQPEPLTFAQGVRFPRPEECPPELAPDLERIAQARITTGYERQPADRPGYTDFFEINAHAPAVWQLFRDLAVAILPEVAAPTIGMQGKPAAVGPVAPRARALAVFEPYVHQLQHDGILEFGALFRNRTTTEEVFVRSPKYIQVWTSQPDAVRAVLERHGIPAVTDLQLLDDFPLVSEPLLRDDGTPAWPDVLRGLEQAFTALTA
jgi:hypothetical protein